MRDLISFFGFIAICCVCGYIFVPSFRQSADEYMKGNRDISVVEGGYNAPSENFVMPQVYKTNLSLNNFKALALFKYIEYRGTILNHEGGTARNVRLKIEYLDDNNNTIETKELHLYESITGHQTANFTVSDKNPFAKRYKHELLWD